MTRSHVICSTKRYNANPATRPERTNTKVEPLIIYTIPPNGLLAQASPPHCVVLRKDRPDLHAQVLDGELSAHAAAVQAGFRPRTITLRLTTPESIAATLCRQLDPDMLRAVVKLIR